mmetsp:Transcript_22585/g.66841  ORF Transcript_22585/g.66841 Transcript_22585/m.66841 type:complete len:222 (-) Transcript_22585:2168-2833(-)
MIPQVRCKMYLVKFECFLVEKECSHPFSNHSSSRCVRKIMVVVVAHQLGNSSFIGNSSNFLRVPCSHRSHLGPFQAILLHHKLYVDLQRPRPLETGIPERSHLGQLLDDVLKRLIHRLRVHEEREVILVFRHVRLGGARRLLLGLTLLGRLLTGVKSHRGAAELGVDESGGGGRVGHRRGSPRVAGHPDDRGEPPSAAGFAFPRRHERERISRRARTGRRR